MINTFFRLLEISAAECPLAELAKSITGKSLDPLELDKPIVFLKEITNIEPIDGFAKLLRDDFSGYLSSDTERLNLTPKEISERGEWVGTRGESKFIPTSEEIKAILKEYGLDGIEYRDKIPDFSECSESTVEIDHMTERRYGRGNNFNQCDTKCSEQWNKDGRDGKTDWTARDVEKWREENGYTWHERNDMKTCDLVPSKINDYFGHLGGVSECRKRDNISEKSEFDE